MRIKTKTKKHDYEDDNNNCIIIKLTKWISRFFWL